MRTVGGVLAVVAGILSFISAMGTAMFCNARDLAFATHATTIIGLGGRDAVIQSGFLFSTLAVVFGACMITSRGRRMSYMLLATSILGGALGGPPVAICMTPVFIGGLMSFFGKQRVVPPPL